MPSSSTWARLSAAVGMLRSRTGTSRAARYSATPSETHAGAPSSWPPIAMWLSSCREIRPRNGCPARTEPASSSIRVEATRRPPSSAYVGKVRAPRWSRLPPGHVGEAREHVRVLDAVEDDSLRPRERQRTAHPVHAVAHRLGDRSRRAARTAVEDAEHTRLGPHRDGGEVPGRRRPLEQRLPGGGAVADDRGPPVAEGEHEADRAHHGHRVEARQLGRHPDPGDVHLRPPTSRQGQPLPLPGQHLVAEPRDRQLHQVAEVAPLPGHQLRVVVVDPPEEQGQVPRPDGPDPLVQDALLLGARLLDRDRGAGVLTQQAVGLVVVAPAGGEPAQEGEGRQGCDQSTWAAVVLSRPCHGRPGSRRRFRARGRRGRAR